VAKTTRIDKNWAKESRTKKSRAKYQEQRIKEIKDKYHE
jgi:hypothetical protein